MSARLRHETPETATRTSARKQMSASTPPGLVVTTFIFSKILRMIMKKIIECKSVTV